MLHVSTRKTYHRALMHVPDCGKYMSTKQDVINCVLRRPSVANTSSDDKGFPAFMEPKCPLPYICHVNRLDRKRKVCEVFK